MKRKLSLASFVMACALSLLGVLLPPMGQIDGNVLIAVGQFLLLTATLLGVQSYFEKFKNLMNHKP